MWGKEEFEDEAKWNCFDYFTKKKSLKLDTWIKQWKMIWCSVADKDFG